MARTHISVLGAGGFLGSHIVPRLLELGDIEIDAIDQDLRKLECTDQRINRRLARIEEPGLIDQVTGRSDVVLSLTALCTPALYNKDPLAVINANYTHLVPLVESCAKRGNRLIHFSTCEVYGRAGLDTEGRPAPSMNEETTALFLGPIQQERWTYACAKQLLERVIFAHGAHQELDYTIIRPFNVIGSRMDFVPGVDGDGVPRVLACFLTALLRNEELLLVDGGEQRRSFISVEDFSTGVLKIVERHSASHRQIFNLGNPRNDVTIRELALALRAEFASHTGRPLAALRDVPAVEFYGPGYDDTALRIPDIDKAERRLDFAPESTLAEMLPGIVRDYVTRYASVLAASSKRSTSSAATALRYND